jgi:hypothetical protein
LAQDLQRNPRLVLCPLRGLTFNLAGRRLKRKQWIAMVEESVPNPEQDAEEADDQQAETPTEPEVQDPVNPEAQADDAQAGEEAPDDTPANADTQEPVNPEAQASDEEAAEESTSRRRTIRSRSV